VAGATQAFFAPACKRYRKRAQCLT
jgi:hypothetical protein